MDNPFKIKIALFKLFYAIYAMKSIKNDTKIIKLNTRARLSFN